MEAYLRVWLYCVRGPVVVISLGPKGVPMLTEPEPATGTRDATQVITSADATASRTRSRIYPDFGARCRGVAAGLGLGVELMPGRPRRPTQRKSEIGAMPRALEAAVTLLS